MSLFKKIASSFIPQKKPLIEEKKAAFTLRRDLKTETFTLGKLYLNGDFLCFTCEDAVREEKIYGETAIPVGVYEVIINRSARFCRFLPMLLNVKNFTGIRIHAGNTKDDTEGCILVGLRRIVGGVSDSRSAMRIVMQKIESELKNGSVFIEVY